MNDGNGGAQSGAPGWNMYVFRDGRHAVAGTVLVAALRGVLRELPAAGPVPHNLLIEALLRAGELECALADEAHAGAERVACITDALALALVDAGRAPQCDLVRYLPATVPATLQVSPPEGFAYYALHPHDFADLTWRMVRNVRHAAVIGIRSIGTTLSAVVAAALRAHGLHARRITVRPTGHPYDRRCDFTDAERQFIAQYRNLNAEFFIADEGPGMSGSSFLSVADALVHQCVPTHRINLLCSREPDLSQLRAANARERWSQYRAGYVRPNSFLPPDAKIYVGAGIWREHVFSTPEEWPASWIHMDRLKFFSPDKRTLYKFEGFGQFGAAVHERARKSFDAGFGPPVAEPVFGFGVYSIVPGRLLGRGDLNRDLLDRIAEYCAFRMRAFRVDHGHEPRTMAEMARFNFREEFGRDLEVDEQALTSANPIIADAHMQPHEWLLTQDGRVLKLDGSTHGDDHFFPGPTDIAWDLAGAIAEWNMDDAARDDLIASYQRLTHDRVSARVAAYLPAYAVFRMAYCKMAAEAVRGSGEEHRLWTAYERYREYDARLTERSRELPECEPVRAPIGEVASASPEPLAA